VLEGGDRGGKAMALDAGLVSRKWRQSQHIEPFGIRASATLRKGS
jgi:hypothetical protein